MAAPVYSHDLNIFNSATGATNWTEATGMLVAGGPDIDTDLAILGTTSISQDRANIGLASQVATEIGPTLPTDGVFLIWHKFFAPNSLATISAGGVRVLVGSTDANYYGWYMDGSDTYTYGGWVNYAIDPTFTPVDQTQGTPGGAYNTVGNGWNCVNQVKKGNPYNTDIIRYGRAISYFANGDLGNGYATFLGYSALNDNATTGRWGLIQSVGGGYLYKGLMSLGSGTTAVDFRDENTSITIDNTKKVSSGFNKIEIHVASSNVEMTRISFTSLGTVSPGSLEVVDNATVLFDSCSFTDMSTFELQSQTTGQTVTWSRCEHVVQSGATIDGSIFSSMSGSPTALYVDNLDDVSACDFISVGTGHAMELDFNASGQSYTLADFTYEGYASISSPPYTGTTGNECIYNNSAGHVELTVNGGDSPSIRNGVGSTTALVTSVILSFSVKDEAGDPISGATAYIDNDNVSPYLMNELTNSAGEASVTWTGGAYASSTWRVRLYGYKPYILTTDIPASGTKEIPVTLVADPNQTLPLSTSFDSSRWNVDYTGKTITNNDSGIGTNLPINTGGTWFVEHISDLFQWLTFESSTGTTIQHTYPIEAITPTQFELINDWIFGDNDNDNKYIKGGSISTSGDTKLWSNLYSLGAQEIGTQMYIIQEDEELDPWWITGDIDILVKVKDNDTFIKSDDSDGISIDGGLWVYSREFGDFFDHNFIDLSAGGRNPISINTSEDSNNESGEIYITVASSTGFVVGNFVKGGTSGVVGRIEKITSNDIYLNSVRGGIFVTSETITEYSDREVQTPTGQATTNDVTTAYTPIMTDLEGISITFGSVTKDIGNGEGLKPYEVVIDCSGETLSNVYQYLKYVVRYGSSGATYTIQDDAGQEYRNASGYTWSDIKIAPFGTYAGGTYLGARGVWIENMAGTDITNYILTDSNGDTQAPPIQYSLELTNLVVGSEIRVYSGSTDPKTVEITGVESSTDTFTYIYTYVSDINTDIVVHNLGYVYIRLYDFVLTNSNASIPIQQQEDRWYSNP